MSNKPDHEVSMARADLYKIAEYAIKLHRILEEVSEEEGLEGWMQSKITRAADYVSSVYHTLSHDMEFGESIEENKKGVRASKRGTKSKNPVAKNAFAAIGSGAAGAHKDKKKAAKQGDTKHKANAYENALHQALEQSLQVMEEHNSPKQYRK
jgi:hypothetical protein